jgi:hypothetical protein
MKVFEIGLLRNGEKLLENKYYEEVSGDIDKEDRELKEKMIMETIRRNAEYTNKISSFEIFDYHISVIGRKHGEKSKFLSYLISDKDSRTPVKRRLLDDLLDQFFNSYPPPTCYNIKQNVFNGFHEVLDEIVGDLSLTAHKRLEKAFGFD